MEVEVQAEGARILVAALFNSLDSLTVFNGSRITFTDDDLVMIVLVT